MNLADASAASASSDDARAVLTPIPSIESFKKHSEKQYTAPPSSFLARWFCCSCDGSSSELNDDSDPTSTSSAANRAAGNDFHASDTHISMSAQNELQSNQRGRTKTSVGGLDRVPMSELSKSSALNPSGTAGVSSPCLSPPPPKNKPLASGAAVRQAQPNQDDKYQYAFKLPAAVYSHETAAASTGSLLSLQVGAAASTAAADAPEPASSPISLRKFEWTLSLHEELSRNKRVPTPRPNDGGNSANLIHMNRTDSRTRLSSLGAAASLPLPSESPEPSELALYVRPESSLSDADRETNVASQFLQSRQPFQPMSRSGSLSAPGGHQRAHSNESGGFVGTMQTRNSQPVLLPDRSSVMEPEPVTNLLDHDDSIPTEKVPEPEPKHRLLQSSPVSIGSDESQSVDNSLSTETPIEYIQSRLPRPHSQNAVFHLADDRDRLTPDRFPRSNSANCNSFNSNSISTSSILSSESTNSYLSSDVRSSSRLKSSLSVASTLSYAAVAPPQQSSSPQQPPPHTRPTHHHHSSRSLGTFNHPLTETAPSLVRLHSDPLNKSSRPLHQTPSQSATPTPAIPAPASNAPTPTPASSSAPVAVAATDDEDDEPRSRTHRSIGSIDFNFEMPLVRPPSPAPQTPASHTPIPPSPNSNATLPTTSTSIERNDLLNALTSSPFVRPSTTATTSSFASERQLSTSSSRRASFTPSLSSNVPNREYSPQLKGLELPPTAAAQLLMQQQREKSASALEKRSTMPTASSLSFSSLHTQQAYLVSASNSPIRGGSRILSANRSSRTQRDTSVIVSNTFSRPIIGVDEMQGVSSISIKQQHNERLKRAAKRLTS